VSKPVVNLPDPLEPRIESASHARADDLLSRMAGEEIDRMMQEAPPITEGPGVRAIPNRFEEPIEDPIVTPPMIIDEDASIAPPAELAEEIDVSGEDSFEEVLERAVEKSDALPLALRPLRWFNAPFAGMSVEARQTLGRAGILLLMNAVAVFVYVLVFGRH
jgi:hypothetical protein